MEFLKRLVLLLVLASPAGAQTLPNVVKDRNTMEDFEFLAQKAKAQQAQINVLSAGAVALSSAVANSGSTVAVTAALTGTGNASNPVGVNSSSVAVLGIGGALTLQSSSTASAFFGDAITVGNANLGNVNATANQIAATVSASTLTIYGGPSSSNPDDAGGIVLQGLNTFTSYRGAKVSVVGAKRTGPNGSVEIHGGDNLFGDPGPMVVVGGYNNDYSGLLLRGNLYLEGQTTFYNHVYFSSTVDLSTNVITTASMTASAFFGDGSHLTGITSTSAISGTYLTITTFGAYTSSDTAALATKLSSGAVPAAFVDLSTVAAALATLVNYSTWSLNNTTTTAAIFSMVNYSTFGAYTSTVTGALNSKLSSGAVAGGVLAGTYPNPSLGPAVVLSSHVANGQTYLLAASSWTFFNIGGGLTGGLTVTSSLTVTGGVAQASINLSTITTALATKMDGGANVVYGTNSAGGVLAGTYFNPQFGSAVVLSSHIANGQTFLAAASSWTFSNIGGGLTNGLTVTSSLTVTGGVATKSIDLSTVTTALNAKLDLTTFGAYVTTAVPLGMTLGQSTNTLNVFQSTVSPVLFTFGQSTNTFNVWQGTVSPALFQFGISTNSFKVWQGTASPALFTFGLSTNTFNVWMGTASPAIYQLGLSTASLASQSAAGKVDGNSSGLAFSSAPFTYTATSSVTFYADVRFSTIAILQNGASVYAGQYPNTPLLILGSTNTSVQLVIQNLNSSVTASGDLSITSDLGGNASYYLNMGINSSRFTQPTQTVQLASSAYVTSSDSDLTLWAMTNGGQNGSVNGSLIFGTSVPVIANEAMRVQPNLAIVARSSITTLASFRVNGSSPVALQQGPGAGIGFSSTTFYSTATVFALPVTMPYVTGQTTHDSSVTVNAAFAAGSNSTFTVATNGNISAKGQPGACIGLAGSPPASVSGTAREFFLDATADPNYNNSNVWQGAGSSSTFKLGDAGVYYIKMCVKFTSWAGAAPGTVTLDCNSLGTAPGPSMGGFPPGPATATLAATYCMDRMTHLTTPGQTIKCQFTQTSGANQNYGAEASNNFVCVQKVW